MKFLFRLAVFSPIYGLAFASGGNWFVLLVAAVSVLALIPALSD
jgi:hypothetical protein